MTLQLLMRGGRATGPTAIDMAGLRRDQRLARIRCPLCRWRPSRRSRWCCAWTDTPEPPFDACGTVWNTFATCGRCPGCAHQWRWTSCLRCRQWSLHDEWYERLSPGHG